MRRYRTFWLRFWAAFIDGLVLIPFTLPSWYLLDEQRPSWVIVLWGVISYSSYWMYSVLLHARFGATVGKMATGVQVLDVSERNIPTLRQAFIRDTPYIVANVAALVYLTVLVIDGSYTMDASRSGGPARIIALAQSIWFVLELATMLTNPKRRALHDLLAGTVVVRKDVPATAS